MTTVTAARLLAEFTHPQRVERSDDTIPGTWIDLRLLGLRCSFADIARSNVLKHAPQWTTVLTMWSGTG